MKICTKCNGELQVIPEKEIGFFKSLGLYLLMEISFWIFVVIVFSFGTMDFETAFTISLTFLIVLTIYLIVRHSTKRICRKCRQRYEGLFLWEADDK